MRTAIREFGIVAVAVMLGSCAGASGDPQTSPTTTSVPVRLVSVVNAEYAEPVEATGTLTTRDELDLSFKVGGVVARVVAQEGTFVRKGTVLAALDLREINASLEKARTGLAKAERDLARVKNLHRDSVATLEQLQDATSAAEIARSDYSSVAFNQRYATIVAPSDGVVLKKHVESGELIGAGQAVVQFGSISSGSVVRVGVADRDAVRLNLGDRASVSFSAYPDRTFAGVVSEIPAAANPMTGTYAIEVRLESAPGMASGLVGRVKIEPSMRGSVQMIPIEAVVEADGSQGYVFILNGDVAKRIPVSIASIGDGQVAINGGLGDATQVVGAGAAYLSDGVKVTVAK